MMEKHSGIYFLAGHDHNLQYITETDDHHIVSGAGSKSNKLRKRSRFKNKFMTDKEKGFVKISFKANKEVEIFFISETNVVLYSEKH
jgi:hypothetical protein